jgi:hypothetical protein
MDEIRSILPAIIKGFENPEKQMKYAKEYISFQDEHYHIATIYNVKDSNSEEHQVIELDVMALGLTDEQKQIFSHINNTEIDQITYPWFNSLNQWEQTQIKKHAAQILSENKVLFFEINKLIEEREIKKQIENI